MRGIEVRLALLRILLVLAAALSLGLFAGLADHAYGILSESGALRYSTHLFYSMKPWEYVLYQLPVILGAGCTAFFLIRACIAGKIRTMRIALLLFVGLFVLIYLQDWYMEMQYSGYVKG